MATSRNNREFLAGAQQRACPAEAGAQQKACPAEAAAQHVHGVIK